MVLGPLMLLLLSRGLAGLGQPAGPDDASPEESLHSQPELRAHCVYPCRCPPEPPACRPGVGLVRDGCGCCLLCAGQRGDPCDGARLCDEARGVVCQYAGSAPTGTCRAIKGRPCYVENETYDNGETFMLDCRTQCTCQNGTYACASLCPQESISPRGFSCPHPRLVELPGQCCREWMCDSDAVERPPQCPHLPLAWSPCSRTCGTGLSVRVSNQNPSCAPLNQTRPCQLRPCVQPEGERRPAHAKIRRGHSCKATLRAPRPVRLQLGRCLSKRRYHPKHCGACEERGLCCAPRLSSSIKVDFECDGEAPADPGAVAELGVDMWVEERADTATTTPHPASTVLEAAPLHDNLVDTDLDEDAEDDDQDLDQDVDEEEEVEGENEEGHRFSKGSQGRLWSVFSAPRKRHRSKHGVQHGVQHPPARVKSTVTFAVQWITKCECSPCAAHPETTTKGIARIRILHRVHRTTVS